MEGSQLQCAMTSSKTCVMQNPVVSNLVILDVVENVQAAIEVEPSFDSTICIGQTVHFTATATNGGASPGYEWLVNGQSAGSGAVFTTNQLVDQDLVVCYLTSSAACVETNPVLSNAVVVSVGDCNVATDFEANSEIGVSVFPNPNGGKFLLEISRTTDNFVVRILNNQGQLALQTLENHTNVPVRREFDLTSFPKGVYYLQIISGTQNGVQKLVLH
jgi:Secretion system C-terminal sorting domain